MKNLLTALFFIIFTTIGSWQLIQWYRGEANKAACIVGLGSVNKQIASLSAHNNHREIWESPELTKKQLTKNRLLPTCPSGGVLTIEHRNNKWRLPELCCSIENHSIANSSNELDAEWPTTTAALFFPTWALNKISEYEAITIIGFFLTIGWLWLLARTAAILSIRALPLKAPNRRNKT